ncbi:MAG: M48 family metallopeptidase [Bdellovibrionales bacterium]|nr:M48 family metallopeptidase [Bdellovibrionales bacterium]
MLAGAHVGISTLHRSIRKFARPRGINRALVALPLISVFVFVCCLSGCSSHKKTALNPHVVAEKVRNEQGYYSSRWLDDYGNYLCERLHAALPEPRTCRISFVRGSTPFAVSPGAGEILISRSMIAHLANEAELAFVLAHELAHQRLEHFDDPSERTEIIPEHEEEADQLALGIVATAGYDPRAGVALLSRLEWSHNQLNAAASHPTLQQRLQAASQEVRDSGWRPPGTVQRRDFIALKRALRLNS